MSAWVSALLLFAFTFLARAEKNDPVFVLPQKPTSMVSDPTKWLSDEDRFLWERQLESWRLREGVEIFLVILPDLGGTPSEYVIKEIATRWSTGDLCGVILFVPGTSMPRIWWQGDVIRSIELDPRAQREMILRMEKKASSEQNDRDRLSSAIYQTSDALRVIHSQWLQLQRLRDKWNDSVYEKWSVDRVKRRIRWMTAASVGLVSFLLIIWWARLRLRSRRRYLFPRVTAQRRFGAPHAGGAGAVVSLSSSRNSL
jgi:hypothetical protein